jgi:triosephosphate isomerase
MQKKKIIIGNWKMNPTNAKEAIGLTTAIKRSVSRYSEVTTVLCPPFVFLPLLVSKSKVQFGAQDVFYEEKGSYTGEVSGAQLKSLGANYVIIGHSERRKLGETDGVIAKKVLKALASDLTPVICIGEEVHDNDGAYLEIVRSQLLASLALVKRTEVWKVIIAYEPIWAVGAPEPMSSYELHQMSLFIRKTLLDEYGKNASIGISVLYGGSADATNAAEIVSKGEVDGLLVGRESLNAEHFVSMLKAVNNLL